MSPMSGKANRPDDSWLAGGWVGQGSPLWRIDDFTSVYLSFLSKRGNDKLGAIGAMRTI